MQPVDDGFVRIFCFISGDSDGYDNLPAMYTACALTSQGRWIAGAVSQTPAAALERVVKMAAQKGATMLSVPFIVEALEGPDPRLDKALEEAFKRMP